MCAASYICGGGGGGVQDFWTIENNIYLKEKSFVNVFTVISYQFEKFLLN